MPESEPLRSAIAGGLAFVSTVVIASYSVLEGSRFVFKQATTPIISHIFWPVTAGFALVVTILITLIGMLLTLGLINKIGIPKIGKQTEYDIAGLGGLIGVGTATLVQIGAWATGTQSGGSMVALGAVALPFAYAFYEVYTPSKTPITAKNTSPQYTEEEMREISEQWDENATINPAFPPGKGPNKSMSTSSNQQSQSNTTSNIQERGLESVEEVESAKQQSAASESTDFSELEFHWVTETDVSFADVGGMDDLKSELRTEVLKPLTTHREQAEKLGVSAPNIIFHGPPGTGKTFMAKALATELGLPFAQLSGADLQSKWINESASKVQTLFEEAKDVAAMEGGAVVFLDELDSVLKDRSGDGSSHEEDRKVVNEFLNHLEDTKDHDIVFVGATNRMDALDGAAIRSGRIDKKVHIGKPDATARKAILQARLADRPHDLSPAEIAQIVMAMEGVVGADIDSTVESAAKQVLDRNGKRIQLRDLHQAIDTL